MYYLGSCYQREDKVVELWKSTFHTTPPTITLQATTSRGITINYGTVRYWANMKDIASALKESLVKCNYLPLHLRTLLVWWSFERVTVCLKLSLFCDLDQNMFISWKVTGKKILPSMATLVEFSWYSDLVCINTVGRSQFIWNCILWVSVHLIICLPSYKVCPLDGNLGTQTHNSVCFTIPSEEQVFQFLQLINLKWQAVTIPAICLLWLSVLWCHFVLTSCSHISTKLTEMVCHCDHNTH